jgi:hypothetical protein
LIRFRMRSLFLLLLLVNLVLLAWGQGYLGDQQAGREPERLGQQMEPDRLRILRGQPSDAAPPVATARVCKRIEGLSMPEAETLQAAVAGAAGWEVRQQAQKGALAHWVVIPELPSRALAEKKRTELRQLGVNEGQIVESTALGPFAVSLGIFRNEELATEFLQSVAKKGVRSARLAKHELPSDKQALELRAPAAELARKLPDLLAPLVQAGVTDCPAE